MRRVTTRAFGALTLAAVTVAALTGAAAFAVSSANGGGGLSKHDRELLAQAKASGKDSVILIIAAKGGANRDVVKGVEAQGGSILNKDDSLGYVLARVATDKVEAVAALGGVQALDLDEVIPLEDPRPAGQVNPTPQVPPGAATPRSNPYMPVQDTGSAAFTAANPTWDGRGVTIGIVDTGIDLDHPSLNVTSTGEAKIIDWVTGTLPNELSGDPTWIDMSSQVSVSGGSFTVGTTAYTGVAADGTYRFGVFNERDPRLGGELGSDVNRDGNPAGSNGTFAVLWRTSDNKVFVDDNADRSFAGEPAMTDYKVNRDKGYFGTDNPATPVKEAVPFVVQTDGKNKMVNIGIVSGAHGSHVAGIAAGNALFGGAMSGQAPGAKIVSLRACLFITGCTAAALTDGMIYVAKQSNVDVINMSIGGLPALNDGNNARALLYGRLIDQTNVQMFISAGNDGSGVNTIGDPGLADKVMGIGSYISKASWQSNYGSDSPVHRQPARLQLARPAGGRRLRAAARCSGLGDLDGSDLAGGPARRRHVHASARLRHVQRHLDGVPGGSRLGRAADQRRQAGRRAEAARSDPRGAQVECPLSRSSARRVRAGRRHHRRPRRVEPVEDEPQDGHDHLVRSGEHGALRLPRHARHRPGHLRPRGRDGRPELHADVHLHPYFGRGRRRQLQPVVARKRRDVQRACDDRAGEERADAARGHDQPDRDRDPLGGASPGRSQQARDRIRDVERRDRGGPVHRGKQLLGDEVGHDRPEPDAELLLPRPRRHARPSRSTSPGRPRLPVRARRASCASIRTASRSTRTRARTATARLVAGGPACNPNSRTTSNPQAGVWEVTIEGRRTSDAADIPFTLTAAILGATVSPNPDTIASASIGVPIARSYTLTNVFGAFTGRAVGTSLGSARLGQFSIAHLAQQQYQTVGHGGLDVATRDDRQSV